MTDDEALAYGKLVDSADFTYTEQQKANISVVMHSVFGTRCWWDGNTMNILDWAMSTTPAKVAAANKAFQIAVGYVVGSDDVSFDVSETASKKTENLELPPDPDITEDIPSA